VARAALVRYIEAMQSLLTRAAEGLDRRRFSVDDVERMIAAGVLEADERFELLDGEIVPMNAQYTPHARMVARIFRWLTAKVDPARFEVFLGATVELSRFSRVDPDVYVARAGVRSPVVPIGEVLWVVEVSDSTRYRDLKTKSGLYAGAGLPELWVVDLEDNVTHVRRGPTADGWRDELSPTPFDAALAPAAFPECSAVIANLI